MFSKSCSFTPAYPSVNRNKKKGKCLLSSRLPFLLHSLLLIFTYLPASLSIIFLATYTPLAEACESECVTPLPSPIIYNPLISFKIIINLNFHIIELDFHTIKKCIIIGSTRCYLIKCIYHLYDTIKNTFRKHQA